MESSTAPGSSATVDKSEPGYEAQTRKKTMTVILPSLRRSRGRRLALLLGVSFLRATLDHKSGATEKQKQGTG
jgi:hypothetical protein